MSKKRKRKRPSSCSDEEEEKKSKHQDDSKSRRSDQRKQHENSTENCAEKRETHHSPAVRDVSHSSRLFKKPVYRLKKTHPTDQKPVKKEEESRKTKSSTVSSHREHCCAKAKHDTYTVEEPQRTKKQKTSEVKKQPFMETKTPSVSAKEPSFTSAKPSPSIRSSKMVNNFTPVKENITSVSQQAAKSTSSFASPLPVRFKIPKKGQPRQEGSTCENNNAYSANKNTRNKTANCGTSASKPKQNSVSQCHSKSAVTSTVSSEQQKQSTSLSGQPPATAPTPAKPGHAQIQVVKELHLARSERRLEVNVMQSYGELTCMDIDPPEEAAESHSKQHLQQTLILVLDTNILISHLDYIKKIRSHGLKALGFPVILIPWVVLQELDSLKHKNSLSGCVSRQAIPAISYICECLKSRQPRLWGQSMQQAAESSNDLNAENNDDRVLQCCLQYRSLYPECALILCTNDKNLCCKALLSGVKALNKNDLEAEAIAPSPGFNTQQSIETFMLPHTSSQVSSTIQKKSFTPVQPHSQKRPELSVEKGYKQLSKKGNEEEANWEPSCVSDFEDCLREVLSEVLEVEMKAAYDDIWLEIVYLKPPWTLQDILQCFEKHWIAVFGLIIPRWMLQTVLHLTDYFKSGKKMDCSATKAALRQAKQFVQAFEKRSTCVPGAICKLENLFNKLQPQVRQMKSPSGHNSESSDPDIVMDDDEYGDGEDKTEEEKQPTSAQVSHRDVWVLFENVWSKLYQTSLDVFKALGFDPHTMQRALPAGGPPPPQKALLCLHNLSSVVSQLLQAFSSILSSTPGLEEAHALFTIIQCNEIVEVDPRLTAQHFHDCFSQQEYREKLKAGGNRLMELKGALDYCLWTVTTSS